MSEDQPRRMEEMPLRREMHELPPAPTAVRIIADHGVAEGSEMDPDLKHEISHRAESFRQLMAACFRRR